MSKTSQVAKVYYESNGGSPITSIEQFVKTGVSNRKIGNDFYVNEVSGKSNTLGWNGFQFRQIKSDIVKFAGIEVFQGDSNRGALKDNDDFDLLIAVVKNKNIVILNGDDRSFGETRDARDGDGIFTISFECLKQMFKLKSQWQVIKELASGNIQIVDFSKDECIKLSAKDRRQIKESKGDKNKIRAIKPPEFGFSLVGTALWHRAAWICFKDKKNNFYIMGQDEGSYFCSQLPNVFKTQNITWRQALRALMPKEAGHDTPRQGEWFMVKVNDKNIPSLVDCITFNNSESNNLVLPIDHEDANWHELITYQFRISKNGTIYTRGFILRHSGHANIERDQDSWYKIVRNTAVRSVSVQGVD